MGKGTVNSALQNITPSKFDTKNIAIPISFTIYDFGYNEVDLLLFHKTRVAQGIIAELTVILYQ